MCTIVLATSGSFGDLHPYLAVGIELKHRGHDVSIATSEVYRGKVTGEGLGFHPMRPDFAPMAAPAEAVRRAFEPRTGATYLLKELVLPFVEETYRDLLAACAGADLLVIHPTLFPAPLVAEKLNIKWVSAVLSPGVFVSAYDPPLLPPIPWMHALRGFGPLPHKLLLFAMKSITRSWMKSIDAIRRREGLVPSRCAMHDDMFSPYGTLAWYSSVLGCAQPDWPEPSRVTGFPFYDRSSAGQALHPALDRFLSSGPAPIVFTLGSSAVVDSGDFFQESLKAVRQIGCRAVFLVGDRDKADALPPDDSIFILPYAPYSELFPRAAAVVHQGGIGTTGCALHAGVPALVVPLGLDQPDNAFRVEQLGVARVLPRRQYSAARVAGHLQALLEQPRYARAAARIGEQVRRENGVEEACDAIETICDTAPNRALAATKPLRPALVASAIR